MTYHDEELLAELLLQWEELYERGQDSSPEELCRDCPHLIEELRARIAAMKATNWLNNPDCDEDPASACSPQATGKVLNGRYRLDTLIATGGFAEVWRAFDTELQRIVAIKLPKPSRLASSTNFITEARRVARLKHPGIGPVFDVGTEDGRCFIVSEYVEGGSLADRLAKSPPAVSETVQWLGEIATALEYAHLHGVIHRDIKPANILIDHHGRALLADFGIAQSAQKTGTFAPSLGSLRYMSPEQLEGKAATPQSDVYSLGVVLHECLTGELPYSSSDPSVLRKEVVEGTTTFKTATPGSLIDVCKKALRRLPHERHSSSAHFASDLERASVAEPPSIRRHARHAWLAAAVGLVALAMTWLYGYGESRTAKPRDEREAARIQQQANDLMGCQRSSIAHQAADAIGITVYQNPDAMVSAFKAGEIDSMDKVPVTLVDQITAMPDVQVEGGLVPDVVNIGFNANPKKTNQRELLDPVVKNAMAHAVNRDKIIETVYNGRAAPAASILTPIAGDYLDPTIKPEAYDLALANQLLDDAGYTKGADGIRTTPAGERMSYEVLLPTDIEGQQRKFEIIQEDWKAIGIETVGKPMDGSAAGAAMMAPDGKYLDFDLHMWSWLGYIDPDFMLMTVMCDQYGNWSDTAYCNPEYDALYAQQAAEMDPAKRIAIVHEMQQILYRDHPYIFIAQSEFVRAYKGGWTGITAPYLVYVSKIPWDTIARTAG